MVNSTYRVEADVGAPCQLSTPDLDETIAYHPHHQSVAPTRSRLYGATLPRIGQLEKHRATSNGAESDRLI
ncbi:hypothetical protein BHE74_00058192, partial [Ensete ventricosum]